MQCLLLCSVHNTNPSGGKVFCRVRRVWAIFWEINRSHPAMSGNPLAARADLDSKVIPISFHGDDVPFTGLGKSWCSQMTVFFMVFYGWLRNYARQPVRQTSPYRC